MPKTKSKRASDRATLASVKKEMAQPRLVKSARKEGAANTTPRKVPRGCQLGFVQLR